MITIYFPEELFTSQVPLLQIGMIDLLTVTNASYSQNGFRVFQFDEEVWPAVELFIYRQYKIDVNTLKG